MILLMYRKMSKAREKFSSNLKVLRLNKGETLQKVSQEIGLSYSFLHDLESMHTPKNPSMETIDKLAEYYGVEVYELFL